MLSGSTIDTLEARAERVTLNPAISVVSNYSGVSSDGGEIRETKETSDSQVPQGSGLLSKLLQRSCQVGRVGERSERF